MDELIGLILGELARLILDSPDGSASAPVDPVLRTLSRAYPRPLVEEALRVAQSAGLAVYSMGSVALTPNGRAFATAQSRILLAAASLN